MRTEKYELMFIVLAVVSLLLGAYAGWMYLGIGEHAVSVRDVEYTLSPLQMAAVQDAVEHDCGRAVLPLLCVGVAWISLAGVLLARLRGHSRNREVRGVAA